MLTFDNLLNDSKIIEVDSKISSKSEDGDTALVFEDESRKRREILARRPSYRKILNDLSSTEAAGAATIPAEIKQEDDGDRCDDTTTVNIGGQYLKVLPAGTIQLGSQDGTLQGIQTLTMTNAGAGAAGTIVQYATQGQDGQFYVPSMSPSLDYCLLYYYLLFIYNICIIF